MGRDDLSTGGAETMNAASTQPRSFDVLCAGLAVGNVVVRPVPEHFSGGDTVQVQEISMMGGGDAFNQACVLAALGEKPALLSRMADDDSGRMMRAALQKRGVDLQICLRAGVWLHIGIGRAEQLFRAFNRNRFQYIYIITAAVISLTGVTLGVFIRQNRTHGCNDGGRGDVLRRDQLDVAPLAVVLCLNRRPYLGVLSGKKLHDILDQIRLHLSQI